MSASSVFRSGVAPRAAALFASILLVACGSSKDDNKEGSKDKPKQGDTAKAKKPPPGPPLVGGTDLIVKLRQEFAAGHSAATAKYAGRKITFTGMVSMTIADDSFRVNEAGIANDKDPKSALDILCRAPGAGKLKVKDKIEISGTFKGTLSNLPGVNFEVSPCTFKQL